MSSARSGVNTMRMSDTKRFPILALLALALFLWGCGGGGSKSESEPADTTVAAAPPDTSIEAVISRMLNRAIERAHYGDVSGLWENELEYLHERETYDFYASRGQVEWAASTADTVQHIDVDSVTVFDHDSALVDATVHFKGPSGQETTLKQPMILYWQDGHWIKPTISVIQQQIAFDSIRNEAIKAAEEEAKGK